MKRLTIMLLLLFVVLNVYAQYSPMLETDKHWRFRSYYPSDFPMETGGFMVNVGRDTLINNKVYKRMMINSLAGFHDCPMPPCFVPNFPYEIESSGLYALFREDTLERKVYHLPHYIDPINCDTDEYVLFDFSLEEGDSLSECLRTKIGFPGEPGSGLVDSITYDLRFDKQRRIINTTGIYPIIGLSYLDKLELMEGIGFENHGFFPVTLNQLVEVCYGDFATCNILSSNNRVALNSNFEIAPNPVSSDFRILSDLPIEHIQIFDAFGKQMLQANESEINIAHLLSGIYFFKILFLNNSIGVRKVIKE